MRKRPALPQVCDSAGLPPDLDEVTPALRDVTHRLLHDLSDTPEDLRDAAALAPLALIKLAQQSARALAARPKRTLLVLASLSAVLAGFAMSRRKRRGRQILR